MYKENNSEKENLKEKERLEFDAPHVSFFHSLGPNGRCKKFSFLFLAFWKPKFYIFVWLRLIQNKIYKQNIDLFIFLK